MISCINISFSHALTAFVALSVLYSGDAETNYPSNIVAKYARNVRTFGAKGDGVTDDTQAFIQALQSGRHVSGGGVSPQTIYVPPGRYVISSTLLVWSNTSFVGEWTDPPTLILAPNSPGFTDATNPQPFVVTVGGFNVPDNSTNWQTRTDDFNASTNNTYSISIRDLNIEIGSGNSGAWGIYWWCAQVTSLRNVTIDASGGYGCVNIGSWGGESVIADCHFIGGQQGVLAQATYQEFFRNCTFTRQTGYSFFMWNGGTNFTFLDTDFENTAPISINANDAYNPMAIMMINCRFRNMPGATFAQEPEAVAMHFERMTFDSVSAVPAFLQSVVQNGVVTQWSGTNTPNFFVPNLGPNQFPIYCNSQWVSGADSQLNETVYAGLWQTDVYPRPDPSCVNIKDLGAAGDGVTDDTQAIVNALAKYNEIYFPAGSYKFSAPLTVKAGQKLFGEPATKLELAAEAPLFAQGSTNSELTVTGNGHKGVVICGITVFNNAPGGYTITWSADPSSVVMDCGWATWGSTPLSIINVTQGGGMFENLWCSGNNNLQDGIVIQSAGPTYFYQLSDEHYSNHSIVTKNASNLVVVNLESEGLGAPTNPGVKVLIQNSKDFFLYGFVGGVRPGTWPDTLVELQGDSQLRLWNLQEYNLAGTVEDFANPSLQFGTLGSQVQGNPGSILCGYIQN